MEIKPQDLRLGNWVKHPNKDDVYQVEEISSTLTVRAIELTPEWLERLGFKYKSGRWIVIDGPLTLKAKESPGGFKIMINGTNIRKINTVHPIQNLYFSLTGEELAIDKHISNGN